jgi:hypothetical protein
VKRLRRGLVGLLGLATVACTPVHRRDGVPAGAGPLVGVYKAAIDDGHGAARGVKLSLWAERPDRLHVELIPPVGGVSLILDAGGGSACIVDTAAATAYVGKDGPDAIEALVGVRVSVADAVAALLDGAPPAALTVTRTGGAGGALPERIRIVDGARSIELARIRYQRGTAGSRALGTGVPPPQLPVRPIEDFGRQPVPRSGPDAALPSNGRHRFVNERSCWAVRPSVFPRPRSTARSQLR